LFPCGLQHKLESSMMWKHLLGMMLMMFLVVMVEDSFAKKSLHEIVGITFGLYLWFTLLTRMHVQVFFLVLAALLMNAIVRRKLQLEQDDVNKAKLGKIQQMLWVFAIVATAVGVSLYALEKKREYGRRFSWKTFMFGVVECRHYTPKKARIFGSI
jgi:hypothetical protein